MDDFAPQWEDKQNFSNNAQWGPTTYTALGFIAVITLFWIIFEFERRKMLSLLDKGYYFIDEFINIRRKRLVPIPPENIDTSDPVHPWIINPSLIDRNHCYLCTCT